MEIRLAIAVLAILLTVQSTASLRPSATDSDDECPDNAVCFPPGTQQFDSENLAPLLTMLGLTGDEQVECGKLSENQLRCRQSPIADFQAYGFYLHVKFWSANLDIRAISCRCLREDSLIRKSGVAQADVESAAERFIRGHLLAADSATLKADRISFVSLHNLVDPKGYESASVARFLFETPVRKAATLDVYVSTQTGRVIKAVDVEKSIAGKGFLMRPWIELGSRLVSSPKDLSLFQEYQRYGAFRGRGNKEADFQDRHRVALSRVDPTGESTYYASFSYPLDAESVVKLLDGHEVYVHKLFYMTAKGDQNYHKGIENLETTDGTLADVIQIRLSEQLDDRNEWYLPELIGVVADGGSGRAIQKVRFTSILFQFNHVDAIDFWNTAYDSLISMTPPRRLGPVLPLPQAELRKRLNKDGLPNP
jgi:hypothetical protein